MASGTNERDDLNLTVDEDYEHLIEDYSHLAPPTEGELLQGHVVKVDPQELIVDFGYKLEGLVPIEQVRQPDGSVPFKARRRHRRDGRPAWAAAGRLRPAVALASQPPAHLGQSGAGHARPASGLRPSDGAHQGRPDGGCGRTGVHARIAGGHAAVARSGSIPGPGYSGQGDQDQSPPRQRGGFAQAGD